MNSNYIADWCLLLISKIKGFDEKHKGLIPKVHVSLKKERYFGREYYRIYIQSNITISLNPFGDIELSDAQKAQNEFARTLENHKEYFSFQANQYSEDEVLVHYEWVVRLVNAYMLNSSFELEIDYGTKHLRK